MFARQFPWFKDFLASLHVRTQARNSIQEILVAHTQQALAALARGFQLYWHTKCQEYHVLSCLTSNMIIKPSSANETQQTNHVWNVLRPFLTNFIGVKSETANRYETKILIIAWIFSNCIPASGSSPQTPQPFPKTTHQPHHKRRRLGGDNGGKVRSLDYGFRDVNPAPCRHGTLEIDQSQGPRKSSCCWK